MKKTRQLNSIHPGEILAPGESKEFMRPLDITINGLARDLHVPPNRIHAIVHGSRSITADTALRLAEYWGVSAETWLNLQTEFDLRTARRTLGTRIRREVRKRDAA